RPAKQAAITSGRRKTSPRRPLSSHQTKRRSGSTVELSNSKYGREIQSRAHYFGRFLTSVNEANYVPPVLKGRSLGPFASLHICLVSLAPLWKGSAPDL